MNERIKQLAEQAWKEILDETDIDGDNCTMFSADEVVAFETKFAELIVEECRNVVDELYRKVPLELCGVLLTADQEIVKHFYGVE